MLQIEYPALGETYCFEVYGVYRYHVRREPGAGTGQTRRDFVDVFATRAAAEAAYPQATFTVRACTSQGPTVGPPS